MTTRHRDSSFIEKKRAVRLLRSSKLVVYDEYKSMLRLIERYHEDVRLSGHQKKRKENDLRPYLYDNGDTYERPFYAVLVKMLTEINSMVNVNKQIEDLQRVYQWYLANKQQLCKKEPMFGDGEKSDRRKSRHLNQRPSSSAGPGNRSGILRHDKIRVSDNSRPRTSNPALRNGFSRGIENNCINDGRILNVKFIDGVSAPGLPEDLNDYRPNSPASSPRLLTRPGTAPPIIVQDEPTDKPSDIHKPTRKEARRQDNLRTGLQSPVSKVSVDYHPHDLSKKAIHIHLPDGEGRNEMHPNGAGSKLHNRTRSADSVTKTAAPKPDDNYDRPPSEVDEDRVVLDPEEFFMEADAVDMKSLNGEDFSKDSNESQTSHLMKNDSTLHHNGSDSNSDENYKTLRTNTPASPRDEKSKQKRIDSDRLEHISSYSKFQKVQSQKNGASQNRKSEQGKGSDLSKSVYQSLLDDSRSLGSIHGNQSVKNVVSTAAVLELVTPIGQQLLEQKVSNPISQPFRGDFDKYSNKTKTSPRDRPSPRLYLRTGLKTDQRNSSLRKAEIDLKPEESPRQYKVHFPKKVPTSNVKHYKVSGPVEPNSQRYQYTDDGFGNRTYVKRLSKSQKAEPSSKIKPSIKRMQTSDTILQGSKSPFMNTKSLTSLMIVRHLGGTDRRSSERMSGSSDAVPVWVAAQDSTSRPYDEFEYLKLSKPYEEDSGDRLANNSEQKPDNLMKSLNIDFPDILSMDREMKEKYIHFNSHAKTIKHVAKHDLPEADSSIAAIEQYNGGYYPLRAQGHALRVENKMQSNKDDTPTEKTDDSSKEKTEDKQLARPSSSLRVTNANRPTSACSKTSSRPTSAQSTRRSRSPSPKKSTNQEPVFNVKDFSHFCFDDNPELEIDYQHQRIANAAVDIQRIFRGYMARKYMQNLKASEKERERKAAVTLQSVMRGFLARKRAMKENVKKRKPAVVTVEWAKQYKEELKKRDQERLGKEKARSKKFQKVKVDQEEKLKKVVATSTIYDIFHDTGPSKAEIKAAVITIQRYVRGWLVRRYFKRAKEKAMKRTLDFNGFLKSYGLHLERIMERHGVKDARATINFDEVLEYIEKRNKYDIEYDRIAKGQNGVFLYEDMKKFFEACGKHPSRVEVEQAVQQALQGTQDTQGAQEEAEERKEHSFSKTEIAEVAFNIYVPKGTKLKDTRKSTWMNPLVDGDEAARLKLTKKINEETNLGKVFSLLSESKKGSFDSDGRSSQPDQDAKNGKSKTQSKNTSKQPKR